MNRAIFVKGGIVLGIFILILGLSYGCTVIKNNNKTPELTDSDNLYVTVDGVKVTDGELYEEMILSNGYSYLTQYVEEKLMASYLSKVTDEELLAEKELLTYGTYDQIIIAEYKANTDYDDQLVKDFDNNMIILGLDPEDLADLRTYLGLSIAKQNYTEEYIAGVEPTDPLFISAADLETYYDENTFGDICTLDIRFNSEVEAGLVLDMFNIVPNYDGVNWGEYDPSLNGDLAIDAVLSGGFDDTNTTVLTNDEAFAKFVLIYNYMNPSNVLAEDITQADFCTNNADMANHNYEDMTRGYSKTSDLMSYVDYIFNTLSLDVDETTSASYSYQVQTIGDFAVIAYKISESDVTPYADLTEAQKDDVYKDVMATKLTSTNLEVAMEELWIDNELVIFEPTIKLQSRFSKGVEFDNNGSTEYVATMGDVEITPRELFDFMTKNFGMYTSLEIAQTKSLLQGTLFDSVYEDTTNYLKSDNESMKQHVKDLEGFKSYFSSDGFASSGLSSTEYTWEEFIILYLQCSDEMDVLEDISIAGNLQNYLINDTINYEAAVAYIQDQVDNYFSLNVEHLLLFVDEDFDFNGDDYSEYLDAMTVEEAAAYALTTASFSSIVQDKIQTMTFAEIVTEYQDSLVGDPTNVWAPFKLEGFYIVTQDLSSTTSLTYASTNGYFDEDFVINLKRAYDSYVLEIDQSIEDPDKYYDDRVFETDFGVHYITATEGSAFEQPTAVFDNADGSVVAGNVGTTIAPNKAQVDLYVSINFSTKVTETNDDTLTTSVSSALDAYYGGLYVKYWPSKDNPTIPVTILTVNYALSNNVVFTEDNVERLANLQVILDTLIEANFPDTYITE